MACLGDTVGYGIGRENAELDLDCRDGVHGVRAADGRGADLAEADAADLAFLDEFREGLDGGFDGDIGVDSSALEDVNLFAATKDPYGFFDGGPDALRAAVRDVGLAVVGALDAEDDLVGILWVLLKVVFE